MRLKIWKPGKNDCMNYKECYGTGVSILKSAEVPEAELDARLLLEFVCHTDRNTLLVHGDREVSVEERNRFMEFIEERAKRVPLQLLTNEQYFYGLPFYVNKHVLIPRQDTEILVEQALQIIKPGMKVLDMCTGSGCILISLMSVVKNVMGYGIDISAEALEVSGINAKRLLPEDYQPKWLKGDLFDAISDEDASPPFDVIVSNPPYIPTCDIPLLMPEVKDYEPITALDGSEDGLCFYRKIIQKSREYLKEEGFLLFEIGYNQSEAVSLLMLEADYKDIIVIKDYAGLDRVVIGKRKRCLIS